MTHDIEYAIYPETHKPVRGLFTVQNPEMTANAAKELALCCGRRDSAAALIAVSPRGEDLLLTWDEARPFTHHRTAYDAGLRVVRVAPPHCADGVSVRAFTVLWHPCDDNLERGDGLDTAPVQLVRAGEVGYVYVEFETAPDCAPGPRELAITLNASRMFEDETPLGGLAVKLDVLPRTLPDRRDRRFFLDLWQHNTGVARAHHVPLWSDAHFAVIERYVESLAALGQKSVAVIASDCPWSGQWCHYERRADADLYESSMIRTVRRADGGVECDYTVMQRYIDLCAEYGIDEEITVFGLVNVWCDTGGGFGPLADGHPEGAKIPCFDEATGRTGYLRSADEIDRFVALLEEYFVKTGQIGRVDLIADEPADVERYTASIDRIARVAPRFKLKAALNHAEFIGRFGDRVDCFVPSLECLSREFDKLNEYRAAMPDKRFLWYVCNQPKHPNTFLASDPCETLAIGALTVLLGLDGFLRWGYTVWCRDPVADNRYFNWPAGDLNFVYPARDGGVMLSLRYMLLKRAVDIAELCRIYRETHGSEALASLLSRVLPDHDPRNYFRPAVNGSREPVELDRIVSTDPADYLDLRRALCAEP